MITVSDITKGYGGRTLFDSVNVAFSPGHKYGLTGPNGAGKSTMMKILIGAEESDRGIVSRPERTAWLRQDHFAFDAHTVMDTVMMGNARLWDAIQRKEAIYAKEDISDEEGELLGELECVVAEEDGYTADAEAATLLAGLGIGEEHHFTLMSEMQGGMKVRVLLAQSLFGKPDAMLLDEPTNHLDLESIQWLEDFLTRYDGVLVVISHDRRFLNAVCDYIADIDFQAIILYPGNYDDMVRQKAQVRGRIDREVSEKSKKIAQLQEFVQRFKAGSRASQVRSRAKQIERLRPDEIKRSNIVRPFIRFTAGDRPSGRDVLEVRDLSHAYEDLEIFKGLNTMIHRGDKVAILGRNAVGKTTLVKALLDEQNEIDGTVKWGHNTRIGYFGHDHREEITKDMTVYTWLFAQRPEVGEQNVRAILGRMLFSGADGQKSTNVLSGGEAARLKMCELILMEYNVLLLDEPTDHLDLESISALRDAIEAYDGTIFYVTHDRDLATAATRILSYPRPGELLEYDGTVDEYLDWYENHYVKVSA
ncbi:MAG: ATP-binding cassette domain-containing protein [Proteobacteria bacterium]|nr:ATP-binding cassette domain-containing protein [Pseudomonadota bacterium]